MAVRTSRITGAREMSRVLSKLPPKIGGRVLANAVRAGARVIAKEAKARVPVRTGALKKSIAVRKATGRRASRTGVRVHVGFLKPVSRRAHLTEFGTAHSAAQPFLRPAFDSRAPAALAKIGQILGRGIERAATKLAGSFAQSGLKSKRRRRR